jgi:hypothetical protein
VSASRRSHPSLQHVGALLLVLAVAAGGCSSDDSSDAPAGETTAAATVTEPAVTESPETDPPATEPALTEPPATDPSPTEPTETAPVVAHLRGTAYTFNTPDPIAGATVKVHELPDVATVTAADGSYEIEVPLGATVTPYIEAEGHHSITVQTFVADDEHDGAEIDGVNFQTPSDAVYDGLKALVSGFTGRDPFEGGCVIVTTVGDARMAGMTFDEFIEFHPHGVEGATVQIDPADATPIYFNEDVLPDVEQQTTSIDGGVLWPNVPPGDYTLSASKPGTEFVEVQVRCEDGWVVNANPVHGLHAIP